VRPLELDDDAVTGELMTGRNEAGFEEEGVDGERGSRLRPEDEEAVRLEGIE
jgi:hypothetical protein